MKISQITIVARTEDGYEKIVAGFSEPMGADPGVRWREGEASEIVAERNRVDVRINLRELGDRPDVIEVRIFE